MVNVQENKKKRIYSFEDVEKMVNAMGYIIIKDSFKFYSEKFTVKDNNGYLLIMDDDNVRKNRHPRIFGKENPYTINNIKHYTKINGIETELLSTEYNNNSEPLLWKCVCGEIFERSWNGFLQGAILCKDCSARIRAQKKRLSLDIVYSKVDKMGYELIDDISNISISNTPFFVGDINGYLYKVNWSDLKNGKHPERFHPCNPYTIQNINNFFKIELNDEYECVDLKYINNMSPLTFRHKKCGCEFVSIWADMFGLKNSPKLAYCKCPECNTQKTESHHASALKQVFLHEYPDTIVEDKSCISPITSYIMPTDIVNHRLRIAIEVQSGLHDAPERKIKDEIKRRFWLDEGYSFYDPDIRDYTILEMIQLFFPHIKEIPEYIDFNFSNCIDFEQVQECLDKGFTIKETASILNLNEHSVRHLSAIHKVELPNGYKEKMFNIRAIVRLSQFGEFIKRYESLASLKDDNLANGTIRRVLNGKQDFAYGSFWLYEDEYLSGDYTLPKIKEDIFAVPVAKYDMSDNYICSYNTIYDAENNSVSSRNEIRRVAKGDRKSSRNEKWKFL